MNLGARIRELRLEKELLQRELSNKIHIASNTLSQFEVGKAKPSYEVLISLADFFQVSTDYLLGRSDDFDNVTIQTNGAQLTKDEEQLLQTYRKLTEKNKMHVSAYAQVRLEEQDGGAPSSLRWRK